MFDHVLQALSENRSPLLFTDLRDDTLGKMSVWDDDLFIGDRALIPESFDVTQKLPTITENALIERIQAKSELVLCGAGHVSVPTAKIAKMCNFSVTVIDERSDFANAERFPDADRIINLPFDEALRTLSFSNPYFVIVTRGHLDDRKCLELIIRKHFAYCGMIGSKRKVRMIFDHMLQNGYPQDLIDTVHAPIGTPIGANTPEEIAVSIVGEMIQYRNQGLSGVEWEESFITALETETPPYAVVTLISKTGSAPRSTGARMIVMPSGRIISTIGGGFGEYEASQKALSMLSDPTSSAFRYVCSMTNDDAAKAGMICGGQVDVLIQIIR